MRRRYRCLLCFYGIVGVLQSNFKHFSLLASREGLASRLLVLGTGLHTYDWAVDSVPLSSARREKIGGYFHVHCCNCSSMNLCHMFEIGAAQR